MTTSSGRTALSTLRGMQRRAWVRHVVATIKRPRNVALLLFGAALVALVVVPQFLVDGRSGAFAGESGAALVGTFLVALTTLTLVAGLRNGALHFKPPEMHFLLPAPLTSRDLVEHHLVVASIRAALSVVFFALFMRPGDASIGRVFGAYAAAFVVMTLLQTRVDLAHSQLVPSVRRARGRNWAIVATLLAAVVVGATWLADGRELSAATVRWLALPAWPVTALMTGTLSEALAGAGLLAAVSVWLWRGALRSPPDVREGVLRMGEQVAKVVDRARRGRYALDGKREHARSSSLGRIPRLGGAGVFAWRQLVSLRRARGAFGMLLYMTTVGAVGAAFVADERRFAAIAAAAFAVLTTAGPMYVRCDFREDSELFPYLRSLPASPTTLAWGQMLPSALVIAAMQWVFCGWATFLAPPAWWPAILLALVFVPLVNLWQLCVWNAGHLVAPANIIDESGTPSATQLARTGLVMFVLMLVIGITSIPAVVGGAGAWLAATELFGASAPVAAIPTVLGAGAVLATEVAVLVWFVGRLFLRAGL